MNKEQKISGLYAIVDSRWNPCSTMAALALKYLEGGCRLIQLRMKDTGRNEMLSAAQGLASLKRSHDFTFIINDHADIAAEVGADGVHVGENDTPVSEIKEQYGDKLIVGYSSHSIEEAKKAVEDGADYVAFGAIFPTKTKGPGHPVQGIKRLRELTSEISVPVVAIGGIGRHNFKEVIEAGASSIAMITALSEAKNIVEETSWFVKNI